MIAAVMSMMSLLVATAIAVLPAATQPSFPVQIDIDVAKPIGPLKPIWRFFGYDEANFTYMKDGRQLLSELGHLNGPDGAQPQVFIRCHHLLTSGDGIPALKWSSTNAYTEDAVGRPVYDWTINDRVFDTYVQHGLRPYVEIGFMPEALSIHPQDYPHHPAREVPGKIDTGQAYPPKDYNKWGELVRRWVLHCVARYGIDQVNSWYWEVWNEPNISYWKGTREEYFKLYDYAVAGVKAAAPDARVGGPETAGGPGGTFLRDFLEHCINGPNAATGGRGAPLDFISFHAKGRPRVVDGHVRMGMASQLSDEDRAESVIASFPQFRSKPVIIGESDPEGCAACRGPQDAYRNGTMYSSYTAASIPRELDLAAEHGVNLQGALNWSFEFENEPYFAGFRVLSSNGIDLPVLNVFRMLAKMSGARVSVNSSAGHSVDDIRARGVGRPDVSAMASLDGDRLCVLIWHYADDDVAGAAAAIDLNLQNVPWTISRVEQFRIDGEHSNAYAEWERMGSPQPPSANQVKQLQTASGIMDMAAPGPGSGGPSFLFTLPRQGVALLVMSR
jgi:xylan 1,4-beta-xylosidase